MIDRRLAKVRAGIAKGVALDPDTVVLRGKEITYRLTQQSGGVYNLTQTGAGLNSNDTLYIFAAGDVDVRDNDRITRRGKDYQVGHVSKTSLFGGVVQTQAGVTEVQHD